VMTSPFQRQFLAPRYWPTWLGLGLLWLLIWLPASWRQGLGRFLGRQLLGRNRKRREIVKTNLAWCLPELAAQHEQLIDRYFGYAGQMLLDLGFFWWASRERMLQQIELEGLEHIDRERQQGHHVITITPHMLALDFGGLAIAAYHGHTLYFAHQARNPLLDAVMTRGRSRYGALKVNREGGMRPIIRYLRNGRAMYIIVDEDLGQEGSEFAPFFGIAKATLTSPARMARMGRAVVIPCTTYFRLETGRYVMKMLPPLQGFPSGDDLADAQQMNRVLEQMIRLAPEQYMWSLRLFQTRPDGLPPPYRMKGKPGSGPRPRPAA
jgi:KDO2-lipid IV(A) lauroyltransferase